MRRNVVVASPPMQKTLHNPGKNQVKLSSPLSVFSANFLDLTRRSPLEQGERVQGTVRPQGAAARRRRGGRGQGGMIRSYDICT
jgi:hypothetical protein